MDSRFTYPRTPRNCIILYPAILVNNQFVLFAYGAVVVMPIFTMNTKGRLRKYQTKQKMRSWTPVWVSVLPNNHLIDSYVNEIQEQFIVIYSQIIMMIVMMITKM